MNKSSHFRLLTDTMKIASNHFDGPGCLSPDRFVAFIGLSASSMGKSKAWAIRCEASREPREKAYCAAMLSISFVQSSFRIIPANWKLLVKIITKNTSVYQDLPI